MKRIIKRINKICPVYMFILLICSICLGVITPLTTFAESYLIDRVIETFQNYGFVEGIQESFSLTIFLPILSIIFFLYLGSNTLPSFIQFLCGKIELSTNKELEYDLIKKLDAIPYENLEKKEFKDKWYRVVKNMEKKLPEFFSMITAFISIIISVSGMLIYIAFQTLYVAVIYIFVLIFLFWFSKKAAGALHELNKTFSLSERRIMYMNEITNNKEYAAERKLFQYTPFINKKRDDIMKKQRVEQKKYDFKFALFSSGIDGIGYIATIFIIFVMFPQLKIHAITIGFFLAFARASLSLNDTIQNKVKQQLDIFSQQKIYWMEYWKLLEIDEISVNGGNEEKEKFHSLEFKNVDFVYSNGTVVLKNVSFKIEEGKHYALVGENGSGKSTIVKLILGLYKPTKGEILINGKNIQDMSQKNLSDICSVVFQDFSRYAIPFEENIILNKLKNEKEYKEILNFVGLEDCEQNLPQKSQTMLGKIEKNGVDLSGGEWQKIAIGRALYRGTDFVIFDEPTASLDPIAESNIYEKYYKMMKNKTTIFISHRLASATLADTILVLKNNDICEMGSHEELLNKKGEYYKMFMSQRQWYWGNNRNE